MSLDDIRTRLEESKRRFLAEVDRHDAVDRAVIATKFLDKFFEPEPRRSDLARAMARETIDLLRAFDSEVAGMVMGVAVLRMKLGVLESGWMVQALDEGQRQAGVPGGANAFAAARKDIEARAEQACDLAIRVETLASSVISLRTLTVRAFTDDNIKVSLVELVRRLRQAADDETKAALKDEAWAAIKDMLDQFGDLALDEAPLLRWRKVIERGAKIVGPKEVDTSPGGTDTMLELLGVLRKEGRALSALDQSYHDAMARLDSLGP